MRFAGTQLTNFMSGTSDFSTIAGTSIKGRGMERRASMEAEGLVAQAGMRGLAETKSAQFQAGAIRAQGQAQGQAAIAEGIGSFASGIGGGLLNMGSGGASKYGFDPVGSQGNPMGYGGRYRQGGY